MNGLETTTREGFKRVEDLLQALDARLRAIETAAVTKIAVMETRLEAAWKKIDEHDTQLKSQAETQNKQKLVLEQLNGLRNALIWIVSAIGILIIGLLWAVFTHQVEIVQVVK